MEQDGCAGGDGWSDGSAEPEGLSLSYSQVKKFEFTWPVGDGATHYQLLERASEDEEYVQVGVTSTLTAMSLTVPLHQRANASYVLRTCEDVDCTDSEPVYVSLSPSLTEAIGYFKASNTEEHDTFGSAVALSGDGTVLAVGAPWEASAATGIDGDQSDNSAEGAGAVYVYSRTEWGEWTQQAYVKASNTDPGDNFGWSVELNEDGSILVVGAPEESSSATDIGGDQSDNSTWSAGAVYVYSRGEMNEWTQQEYVKAFNPGISDSFGTTVALSAGGTILAVGAIGEDSAATGVNGDEWDNSADGAGAVYVYVRNEMEGWIPWAYIKASNTDGGGDSDRFGSSLALSGDGTTLAVGAPGEDSSATGVDGNQANNSAADAGAVYVYAQESEWVQKAYIKASNTDEHDLFGWSVALSEGGSNLAVGAPVGPDTTGLATGVVYVYARHELDVWTHEATVTASNTPGRFGWSVTLNEDGNALAVGAPDEASCATGIDGDQSDESCQFTGAVYLFSRNEMESWLQQAYVKASNQCYQFGGSMALSQDASTLAVGATYEFSNATGIGGEQFDHSVNLAGAVYLY
jgi:hypothetical protein